MRVSVLVPAPPPHRVRLGVVFEAGVASSSEPDLVWEVRRFADGHWECRCPGFLYQARADGLCRHIDRVKDARALTLADIL